MPRKATPKKRRKPRKKVEKKRVKPKPRKIEEIPLKISFGPAGKPIGFRGDTSKVPEALREMGLNALEIQQVRQINIKKEQALIIREEAEKNNVILSMHGPYAINFSAEKQEVIEASQARLLKALELADWLGAYVVVFHPGYYGRREPRQALEVAIESLSIVAEEAKKKGIKAKIGPEITGKKSQLGDLDEIIEIVKAIPNSMPVIDFAHLHARCNGCLEERKDYEKIFEKLESELGSNAFNPMHIHFSKIEYSEKGERRHHIFGDGFGPKFIPLAQILIEQDIRAVIISESPILEQDALKMKRIIIELLKGKKPEELEHYE